MAKPFSDEIERIKKGVDIHASWLIEQYGGIESSSMGIPVKDIVMLLDTIDADRQENKKIKKRIAELEKFDGNDDHPENRCERCRGRNLHNWYADNDIWNKVVGEEWSVLCPFCFVGLAKEKGIDPTAWRISLEGDEPELNKTRTELSYVLDRISDLEHENEVLKTDYQHSHAMRMAERKESAKIKAENQRLRDALEKIKQLTKEELNKYGNQRKNYFGKTVLDIAHQALRPNKEE